MADAWAIRRRESAPVMVVVGAATARERKGEHEQGETGERNRGGVFPGRFWAAQQQLPGLVRRRWV